MATTTTHLSLTKQTGSEGGSTGATGRLAVLNDNWDIIDALFHGTTGHSHDGTSGEGPKIGLDGFARGSTAGTVVTSNGSGADPTYQSIPGSTLAARNETGSTLTEGTLVYVSGWNETQLTFLLSKADANVNGAMATFIMQGDLANNTSGTAYKTHRLESINTSASSAAGDPVYLSETAGSWTLTAPTADTSFQQVVGRVAIDHASTGAVQFNLEAGLVIKQGTTQRMPTNPLASSGGMVQQTTQNLGLTAGTTNSTTYVDIPSSDGQVTLTTTGGDLLVWYTAYVRSDTDNQYSYVAIEIDGGSEVAESRLRTADANVCGTYSGYHRFTSVAAGAHTVAMRWKVAGNTSTMEAYGGIVMQEIS
ncbi:hypothetical protein CMI37_06820 [Candidatus Pacearchaeota archaeon]|nr:hypothetical protein [Candidatus Pacearchaeota archaeon]|tara:strand:+ start:216 stop:1307 length:1092 start_codon:yes stop_codon:yes gene_type:complete